MRVGMLVSVPAGPGTGTSQPTEALARLEAFDLAQFYLGNDPGRVRVDVTLWLECWACGGAGRYAVKGKRSIFGTFKPCCVCKGDPLEFAAYTILRD